MSGGKNIAVVGAGISGLSCAYELHKAGFNVTVFEKENYVGGRMASRKKDGLYFDIGADHLINLYEQTRAYCDELEIPWLKVEFLDYAVFRNGKLMHLEKVVGLLSRFLFFLQFFRKRKIDDFFDLSKLAKYNTDNAYDYTNKRIGREISDYLVDGFASTYQFHGADEMSIAVLLGVFDSIKNEESKWYLHHLEGGMSRLPEAMADKLKVWKSEGVNKIVTEDVVQVESTKRKEEYDIVVLAATANAALKMFRNPSKHQEDILKQTEYASTISVSYRVQTSKMPEIGIVWSPKVESKVVSGYVNEAMKGKDTSRDGRSLFSVWLHEDAAKKIIGKSDDEIFKIVKVELLKVCPWFETEDDLENFDLQRWPAAMPKFSQGHLTRVAEFLEEGHQGENNVYLCGDYMNSFWIEGSIRCGQRTAKQILAKLQ